MQRELVNYIKQFAVRTGDFQLSSGGRTGVYIDFGEIWGRVPGSRLLRRAISDKISSLQFPLDFNCVGGPAMMAIPLITLMHLDLHVRGVECSMMFIRGELPDHGLQRHVEGHLKPDHRVMLVDDVVTTGRGLEHCVKVCREEIGCTVQRAMAVIDRSNGAVDALMQTLKVPYSFMVDGMRDLIGDVAAPAAIAPPPSEVQPAEQSPMIPAEEIKAS